MIVELLVLGGIGYVAHRTRPPPASFAAHYSGDGGPATAGLGARSFVDRLLGTLGRGSRAEPTIHFIDLIVAWLVRVEETGEYFLGIFGYWLPLLAVSKTVAAEDSLGRAREMGRREEEQVERQSRLGHQLKAAGEYRQAAQLYEQAAVAAERGQDPFSAPELYDEAARCIKMAGDSETFVRWTVRAAQLFQRAQRAIRAAVLYEKLGRYFRSQRGAGRAELEQASDFFGQAQALYEAEEDGRAAALNVERLHIAADLGHYLPAAEGFEREALRLIQRDSLLINQSQRLLLFACMCHVGLDEPVLLARRQREYERNYAWFGACREGRLARLLADVQSQAAEGSGIDDRQVQIERLQREKGMLASMPDWFDALWNRFLGSLEAAETDIT